MVVNRLDFLRVLKIVKSVGVNEVKFDEQGRFSVLSPDNVFLKGKGLSFGRKLAFMDISMLEKMLDTFSLLEVNIEFDKNLMLITGGGMKFGYRLADYDIVESVPDENFRKVESLPGWISQLIDFERLKSMKKLIDKLGVDEISFQSIQGGLKVYVGQKDLFYGEVFLEGFPQFESSESLIRFDANQVKDVLSVVDEPKIEFSIRPFMEDNIGLLRVKAGEFVWYIGALLSGTRENS